MRRDELSNAIAETAGTTIETAEKVVDYYKKIRAVRVSAHDGFQIQHGAFLDRDVLIRAVEEVSK